MGKFSRDKGKRHEYKVRDLLRGEGFYADRVPSSGAAQGFKGDIKFGRDGKTWLAEVKARKAGTFKHIYAFYEAFKKDGRLSVCIPTPQHLWAIDMADTMSVCARGGLYYDLVRDTELWARELDRRTPKRLLKLQEFVKECDYLVIVEDRKPPIFIRFR